MSEPNVNMVLGSFPEDAVVAIHGASRGIGLAFARLLASSQRKGPTFLTCRDPESSTDLLELREANERSVFVLRMDAADEESVAAAAAFVRERAKDIAVVVNCFGILHDGDAFRPEKRIADLSASNLLRSFSTNAVGPALVAKHFTPMFPARGRCVFASLSARVGSIADNRLGGWYAYRASKAAQNMITKGLSIELRRTKKDAICVALHPGTTSTGLSDPFIGSVPPQRLFSPERAARQLLDVIDRLRSDDNGCFFAWDGSSIPW